MTDQGMTSEMVAETAAKTLAAMARKASIPAFTRIAFDGDRIAIEAIDGGFFILTVAEADHIEFYGDIQ